jgi:hypothetical protein
MLRTPSRLFLLAAAAGLAACGSDRSDPLAPSGEQSNLLLGPTGILTPGGATGGAGGGAQDPDAAYLASTTKIDISGIAEYASVSSVTDGRLTANFTPTMNKRKVGSSWGTWSSPPFAEESQPHILYTNGSNTLTIDLSRDVSTFGLEVEGDSFNEVTFTAYFYNGSGGLVTSVTRPVVGAAGARLFASSARGIRRVVVTATVGDPGGFSVGQLRYATGGLIGEQDGIRPPSGNCRQLSPLGGLPTTACSIRGAPPV